MSLLDDVSSVLLVHAHPDDETITTGALAAELVSRGIKVWLLTATRGERGEVVPGPLSALEGTDALTRERELELDRAVRALGLTGRYWLGQFPARAPGLPPRQYRDSGMTWIRPGLAGPASDVDAAALVRAAPDETAADLTALVSHLHPSLVISYGNGGGYGHPDHVRTHEVAVAATTFTGTPFAEIVADPDEADEWFTLDRHLDAVTIALDCHASQLTVDGAHIVHSGGQREPITTSMGLHRR